MEEKRIQLMLIALRRDVYGQVSRAKDIGLIDRFGGLDDAIKCAAAMAKLTDYSVREYPEPKNIFEQLFGKNDPLNYSEKMKTGIGRRELQNIS